MDHRLPSWLVGPLLAVPLLVLTAWVVRGFSTGASHPGGSDALPTGTTPRDVLAGWPAPLADLPEERFEERVNGAADALRTAGCRRLLYWRLEDPPADAELLVFRREEEAQAALEREAGPQRTPGPGEEAQVTEQFVYFRRGTVLVRLFLDPGVPALGLVERANEIDGALAAGGPR